jgi:hypothetical protein
MSNTSINTNFPSVGIFFIVDGAIIEDKCPIDVAEDYGAALQYGGHYEYWEALVSSTLSERKFKARAYDAYPRGRVVYFPKEKRFVIYADKCIDKKMRQNIQALFGLKVTLGLTVFFEYDEHYQCSRCNRYFTE